MTVGFAKAPCYSARLIVPFVRVLHKRGIPLPISVNDLGSFDPDMRVPIMVAERQLLLAIELTGDPDLGLVAGGSMTTGDCPALDYSVSTAATVREAIETAMRHARLANDALAIDLEVNGSRAQIRLTGAAGLHRASADFMMAGLFTCHVKHWLPAGAQITCHFVHARPQNSGAYERTFVGTQLQFAAVCYGFSFDSELLERAPRGADPRLHAMANKYASLVLAELPGAQTLSEEIRKRLPAELSQGRVDAASLARKLHMSVRTLGRRLEAEGTSYKALLEDVRKQLALRHLARNEMSIPEVAYLLGFAEVSTFHRAFKRWMQQTPGSYRAEHMVHLTELRTASRH